MARNQSKNKDYFTCFSQLGIQLTSDGNIFKSSITASFNDPKLVNETIIAEQDLKNQLAVAGVPKYIAVLRKLKYRKRKVCFAHLKTIHLQKEKK